MGFNEKYFKTPRKVIEKFESVSKKGPSLDEIKKAASKPNTGFLLAFSKGIDKDKINFSITKDPSLLKGIDDKITIDPESPYYGYLIYGVKDSKIMIITRDRNYNLELNLINLKKLNNKILEYIIVKTKKQKGITKEALKELFKTLIEVLKNSKAKGGLIKLNPKDIKDVKTKELSFAIPIRK